MNLPKPNAKARTATHPQLVPQRTPQRTPDANAAEAPPFVDELDPQAADLAAVENRGDLRTSDMDNSQFQSHFKQTYSLANNHIHLYAYRLYAAGFPLIHTRFWYVNCLSTNAYAGMFLSPMRFLPESSTRTIGTCTRHLPHCRQWPPDTAGKSQAAALWPRQTRDQSPMRPLRAPVSHSRPVCTFDTQPSQFSQE